MKILGLDVGDKRIGISVCDDLMISAGGICTLERVGIRKDTGKILECIKNEGCSAVVIGLPLNLDGSDSIQTEKVRDFSVMLENKLRSNGMSHVEVMFQDERLTTVEAERVLLDADMSRKRRKEVIDKQAAVIILQSWLEANRDKYK